MPPVVELEIRTPATAALVRAIRGNAFSEVRRLVERGGANLWESVGGLIPFHAACDCGHYEVVKYLLKKGGTELLRVNTPRGTTPLMLACGSGSLDLVKLLVDKGADVEAKNIDGISAVGRAVCENNIDVVRYLLKRCRASPDSRDHEGATPFIMACVKGYVEAARALAEAGANVLATTSRGCSALHGAVENDQTTVIEFLLQDERVEVDARGMDGNTPLSLACLLGNMASVLALVGGGGDVSFVSEEDGSTLLHLAAKREGKAGRVEGLQAPPASEALLKFLLATRRVADVNAKDSAGRTALHYAVWDLGVLRVLLRGGADPCVADAEGMTPLHLAAKDKATDVLLQLLEDGRVDVNARCTTGASALDLACWFGDAMGVGALVRAGAEVGTVGPHGATPLFAAARAGNAEVVRHLLETTQVDIDASGYPDHVVVEAARHGHVPVLRALFESRGGKISYAADVLADALTATLEGTTQTKETGAAYRYLLLKGAGVMWRRRDGLTLLHLACREGRIPMVEMLVAQGANVEDWGGARTPLMEAAASGSLAAARILVEKGGAKVWIRDRHGTNAVQYALAAQHEEVAEYLRSVKAVPSARGGGGRAGQQQGSNASSMPTRQAEEAAAAAAAALLLEEEEKAAVAAAGKASKRSKKKSRRRRGSRASGGQQQEEEVPVEEEEELTVGEGGGEDDAEEEEEEELQTSPSFEDEEEEDEDVVEGEGCDEEEDDEASVLTAVVQEHLMCPISFVLLTDPVMAADGNTYQRAAIEEWFMRCQTSGRPVTSPLTGLEMGLALQPNFVVRSLALDLESRQQPQQQQQQPQQSPSSIGSR